MSDFFEHEAEEGSTEESDASAVDDAGGSPKRKKKEKKKKTARRVVDSDDEEEGEDLDQDLEGLIDDNPVEEDGEDEVGKDSEESELDDELEDDEIDLLEENLGIKIDRSKKRKRIRTQISSDEESEAEGEDREKIARHIFVDDDDEVASDREQAREEVDQVSQDLENIDEQEEGDESDYDDFIVDDEGQPISKMKKKKLVHNDVQLQEAQDIFGVDFDFDDFEQYDEDYEEDEEEEEDEYEDEEDVDGEVRPKQKKTPKRKQRGKSIYQLIEPSELERGFHTDVDQEIRTADMPERFQLRSIPVCPTEEGELDEEAEWIYKFAFATSPVSQQDLADQNEGMTFRDGRFQSKSENYVMKIKKALNFMRNQQFEVPFIAFYRKEYVETELNINNLWKVYHWDEKWMQLRSRKQNLIRLFEKMQVYQFEANRS
ncbi:hypothetical protein LSH36_55g00040 [Paralvinella palmiformis]|uniref:Helix-turn-helix DNA-binding domain-containing protein n=1 Tax=Paralvinella palmiformis TaxID=53620 RepID=A0AAD9K525_9ANNE|nr:hypothetical protein LSH36_55g00040 [Paralvinella palmiformis]